MNINRHHYSGLSRRLPLSTTSKVNDRLGGLYFNPLIPLRSFQDFTSSDDARRIKYGVVSKQTAVDDLRFWESFSLAGRLQKPVLPILMPPHKDDCQIRKAMRENLSNALNLALFLNFHKNEITLEELFTCLCGLSY